MLRGEVKKWKHTLKNFHIQRGELFELLKKKLFIKEGGFFSFLKVIHISFSLS